MTDIPSTLIEGLYTLAKWFHRGMRSILEWIWLYLLAGAILTVTIVGGLELIGVETGIPYVLVDPMQVVAITAVLGALPAKFIVDWFLSWKYEDVYRVNSELDPMVQLYYVGPQAWEEKTVVEGHTYSDDDDDHHYVRTFSETGDGVEVTGPHRGEMTDVEVETFEQAVKANRGTLRKWANIGQNLYSMFPAIAQGVESAYWRAMSDSTLDKQSLHPDKVKSQVVENVDELVDSIETPDTPDAGDMLEQAADGATDGQLSDVTDATPANNPSSDGGEEQ
jgi:hypothetical protein